MSNKTWWLFKDKGQIVRYTDGSVRIYPTKAKAKADLRKMGTGVASQVTIERVWLEWEWLPR